MLKKASNRLGIIAYLASLKSPVREMMFEIRSLIMGTHEEITEDLKNDSIVFSHHGDVARCSIGKDRVTLVFFNGAALRDTYKLLRTEPDGKARSIVFTDLKKFNKKGLQDLIRQAIALHNKNLD
jgi:hypothetical protein